jgi:hypothetical protein
MAKARKSKPDLTPAPDAPLGRNPDGSPKTTGLPDAIFLHGRDALGRAIGPNDFRLQREAGETEEAFRVRALQLGTEKRLPWLAFERPALPPRAMPAFDEAEAG